MNKENPENQKEKKTKKKIPMLPPENPIELKPPGSVKETITQKDLRMFYNLEAKFIEYRNSYYAVREKLQEAVKRGASVEPGMYKVAPHFRMVRRPKYRDEVIALKGEAYQQKILANTAPHMYFRVYVH